MSLGAVLDTAIGLFFTFLLMAIIVSGLFEAISGWMSLRGAALKKAVASMLSGVTNGQANTTLFDKVFGHGLIEDLAKNRLPAYVEPRNFSAALFESLKGLTNDNSLPVFSQIEKAVANLPPGTARESLSAFVDQAAGDLDALQKRVETWYDDAMNRISGDYKRHSQLWIVIIGLVMAVGLNVDALVATKSLWTNSSVRATVDQAAKKMIDASSGTPQASQEAAKAAIDALMALPLPLGWQDPHAAVCIEDKKKADKGPTKDQSAAVAEWNDKIVSDCTRPALTLFWEAISSATVGWKIVGWLITGIAAALGAPFWFSLLQQLLNLRNTGPKPQPVQPDAQTSTRGG